MISNGPVGTLKGHVFDPEVADSMPTFARSWSQERREREAKEMTARYKIVETCDVCHEPLIAEELLAHKMNHVPSKIRAMVRTVMALEPSDRKAVLETVRSLEG